MEARWRAREAISKGDSVAEICKELGISKRVFYLWHEKNVKFQQVVLDNIGVFWAVMGMKLIELSQEGMCKIEIAAEFGVGISTFHLWINDEDKLKPYWDVAHTQSFAWWWRKVRNTIEDPKTNKAGIALLIWTMKVRFGLFDTMVMERLTETTGVSDKVIVEAEVRLKKIWEEERRKLGDTRSESITCIGKEEN